MKNILTKLLFAIIILSSCDSGYDYYDYNYYNYKYRQVIRFGDTNRIFKQINYFEGLRIDSPNASASDLKISPHENTRIALSDGKSTYFFELRMKFKMDTESDEYNDNIFVKKFDGIEIVRSTAKKTRQSRFERNIVGNPSWNRTTEFIDSLIIE